MPAKTEKQRKFAAMSRTPKGRAALRRSGKKPMPAKAAKDYSRRQKR